MNCEELVESLWREAEKKIDAITRETAEEQNRIVQETLLRISRLREEGLLRCSSDSGRRTEEAASEAEKKARQINIAEELRLSERLYRISQASLHKLRDRYYQGSFGLLAEELPPLAWKTVRINPDDAGLAQKHFPGAGIVPDEAISGGMDVMTEEGKIRVVNTFEKRLERAWVEILPAIMKELNETV